MLSATSHCAAVKVLVPRKPHLGYAWAYGYDAGVKVRSLDRADTWKYIE